MNKGEGLTDVRKQDMANKETPIRLVAEKIAAGEHSYLQLVLLTSGASVGEATEVVSEMVKKW